MLFLTTPTFKIHPHMIKEYKDHFFFFGIFRADILLFYERALGKSTSTHDIQTGRILILQIEPQI